MSVTLEESYERCRRLNRRYGTTYYWSTFLLPRVKRHHVHALYGFCRHAGTRAREWKTSYPLASISSRMPA